MQPNVQAVLRRLGFFLWGVITLALAFQVVNLSSYLDDQQYGYQEAEHTNEILRGLVVPLARSATKKDILVLVRRLAPTDMIVETDSSVALNGLTFQFDSHGVVDTVLSEYDP